MNEIEEFAKKTFGEFLAGFWVIAGEVGLMFDWDTRSIYGVIEHKMGILSGVLLRRPYLSLNEAVMLIEFIVGHTIYTKEEIANMADYLDNGGFEKFKELFNSQ